MMTPIIVAVSLNQVNDYKGWWMHQPPATSEMSRWRSIEEATTKEISALKKLNANQSAEEFSQLNEQFLIDQNSERESYRAGAYITFLRVSY